MALARDRAGDGPPLVLLHPLGTDRRVWDPVLGYLRDRRDVIALDLPGFGESPPLLGQAPTPAALAAAVAHELAEIGVQRPHVAGNSLGGWVALELGLRGDARSVAAIAPAGLWPQPLVPKAALAHRAARALVAAAVNVARTPPGRRLLLRGSVGHPSRVPSADAAHLIRAYATAPGFTAVNDAMRARRFEGLERIRCPVTLIWPERDRLIERPPWVPDRIHNVVLADCGHIPTWDAPELVAQTLIAASGGRERRAFEAPDASAAAEAGAGQPGRPGDLGRAGARRAPTRRAR